MSGKRSAIIIAIVSVVSWLSAEAAPLDPSCRLLLMDVAESLKVSPWNLNRKFFQKWMEGINDFKKFSLDQYGQYAFGGTRLGTRVLGPLGLNAGAIDIYQSFQSLGEGFEKLLIDPALVQQRERFIRFVKNHPPFSSAWEARAAYRESTLDVFVYRAMTLDGNQLKEILGRGIESNVIRGEKFSPKAPHYPLEMGSRLYSHMVFNQTTGWNSASPFISVSAYPEIALGVSTKFGANVHLFKIKVKEADLIAIGPGNGLWAPVSYPENFTLFRGEEKTVVPADDRIESLILFKIPPSAIEEISAPPNAGYQWGTGETSVHPGK